MDSSFVRRAGFGAALVILGLCYLQPLDGLVRFALASSLYSHILLIPFLSLGMAWWRWKARPAPTRPYLTGASIFALAAVGLLVGASGIGRRGGSGPTADDFALVTLSFVGFFIACCCVFWGRPAVRHLAYPLGFLVFLAPLPSQIERALEALLQSHSAAAAFALFRVADTPVLRDGLSLHLPGMTLEVAPECSGIHSTLVLFITSVLMGYFWLNTPWKRALLALLVLPLGVLRNGLRIFTIGELCVHIDPGMIDSPIHRQGGPLFFLLALAPFLGCAFLLSYTDRDPGAPVPDTA